jgi:hypothetical protein
VVDPKEHSMHEVVGIMTGAVVHDIEHQGGSEEVVIPEDAPPPTPEEERANAERERTE